MKNETTIALAGLINKRGKEYKGARGALGVGKHEVDATVHISGTLTIEPDTDKASTASILNEDFLCLVLHHAGITRKSAIKVIEDIAEDYLFGWDGSDEAREQAKEDRKAKMREIDPDGDIKEMMKDLKNRLPRTPSRGMALWDGVAIEVASVESTEITVAEETEEKVG